MPPVTVTFVATAAKIVVTGGLMGLKGLSLTQSTTGSSISLHDGVLAAEDVIIQGLGGPGPGGAGPGGTVGALYQLGGRLHIKGTLLVDNSPGQDPSSGFGFVGGAFASFGGIAEFDEVGGGAITSHSCCLIQRCL